MFKDLLVNAYTLEIEPLDVDGALLDHLARRSTAKPKYKAKILVRGQFMYRRRKDRNGGDATLSGADVTSVAESVITRRDADRAGYEPRMGDRLLRIIDKRGRSDALNMYVTRAAAMNEQPGGFADWVVYLTDRHPGRAASS